jgi:hypothetical protein
MSSPSNLNGNSISSSCVYSCPRNSTAATTNFVLTVLNLVQMVIVQDRSSSNSHNSLWPVVVLVLIIRLVVLTRIQALHSNNSLQLLVNNQPQPQPQPQPQHQHQDVDQVLTIQHALLHSLPHQQRRRSLHRQMKQQRQSQLIQMLHIQSTLQEMQRHRQDHY